MDFAKRRGRLRAMLKRDGSPAMLVTNVKNVRYLTGFTGDDSYLIVSQEDDLLLSDPRYEQQIGEECGQLPTFIRQPGELILEVTARELSKRAFDSLVIEADSLPVTAYDMLQRNAKVGELKKASVQVEALRNQGSS